MHSLFIFISHFRSYLLFLLSGVLLLVSACSLSLNSPNNTEDTGTSSSSLVGIWDWSHSRSGDGSIIGQNITFSDTSNDNYYGHIQFNSDGSYYETFTNYTFTYSDTGTWKTQGNQIMYDAETQWASTYNFSIEDNVLYKNRVVTEQEYSWWEESWWNKRNN